MDNWLLLLFCCAVGSVSASTLPAPAKNPRWNRLARPLALEISHAGLRIVRNRSLSWYIFASFFPLSFHGPREREREGFFHPMDFLLVYRTD
ncbi:hypothetical protein I7I50_09063 [Histoplasma capsulatum G186AR]|uniref:Secreted protein n=1 Tax=Ajellomyces capsulatus TaxID=5037 RepID=A0A8H8D057_AJECA|nr:hypothetical protein I7I52_06582 [Histoplasma capsulatum]QSS74053.1 hypothetical protein I7I50_09063 [Histoplasma capsulatum G186AR]